MSAVPSNEQGWSAVEAWGRNRFMSPLESLMWKGETHPRFSSAGVIVELLDSVPDWERLRSAHAWGTSLVPRLRQRVAQPLLPLAPPAWSADSDFDLDYHLRRSCLPGPGTIRQLLDLAQVIAQTPLDRARPLWEGTLVEGFDGGRAAYILHAHHCLMDGAGIVQLLSAIHSNTREPSPHKPAGSAPALSPVTPLGLTATAALGTIAGGPRLTLRALAGGFRAAAHPARSARYAASVRRVLNGTAGATPSPLRARGRHVKWRYGVLECSLAEMKVAGRAAGGTVNDAYYAAVLGGIRRYHESLGIALGSIPAALPVSIRRAGDAPGGNRFTAAFFAGPAGTVDPARRIAAIGAAVRPLRDEPALDFIGALTPALGLVPGPVLRSLTGAIAPRADVSASNVPGIEHPVYAAGAAVERIFILGPLPNVAMLATMISHVGTCCLGFSVDGDVYTDTERLWRCMADGLDEVLALARPPRRAPRRPAATPRAFSSA